MAPVSLSQIIKEFKLEEVVKAKNPEDIYISIADVTRPGLQLAGHFDHFGPDRIQLIGNMETAFLDRLDPERRMEAIDALFSTGIPCLIMTRNHEVFPEIEICAIKYDIPVLRTEKVTATFMSSLI